MRCTNFKYVYYTSWRSNKNNNSIQFSKYLKNEGYSDSAAKSLFWPNILHIVAVILSLRTIPPHL